MGFERKHQVQAIDRQQHEGDADVQQLLLSNRAFGRKEPAERARHDQTSHRQQHHRAVRSCGDRIEFLVDVAKASEQKAEAQGEQQIGQNRADQRSPHHIRVARLQRHERDNQLRRVAERRIEQATNSFACACGDLLRSQHDEPGDGDYGYTSAKKNPRVRLRRDVLKRHSDRHKDEKPIDRNLSSCPSVDSIRSVVVTLAISRVDSSC